MPVIAKFKVGHIDQYETSSQVHMHPVYAPPGSDQRVTSKEDGSFWDASPSGELKLMINNPLAGEQFQPGQNWYLTFERADG